MLKLRAIAKSSYRKEIGNGRHTSFWYDNWSERGILIDILGERGTIELGIRKEANVEEAVLSGRRRRRHRLNLLNVIEADLNKVKDKLNHQVECQFMEKRLGIQEQFLHSGDLAYIERFKA
ncbi:hypothetical protein Bca101_067829 [Brassica carinata]